jgi:hypothetical protein
MPQDWTIQSRSHHCATTGRAFVEGEVFYALLFDDKTGYRREDISEEAYRSRPAEAQVPFSFWRAKYQPPPPPAPEPLGKQTAEDLLRQYMAADEPHLGKARFLLAVMLERKRILKEIEVKRDESGSLLRIYEHGKSGEVFVIPDPELKLDELTNVQNEVAGLLAPGPVSPCSAEVDGPIAEGPETPPAQP